jgi:hypothetical protein
VIERQVIADLQRRLDDPAARFEMDIPSMDELAQRLLRLEGDPNFVRLLATQTRTNLFRIVGTTETERWHSAFWSWVFDPDGSHGLGDFALRRLLVRTAGADGKVRAVHLRRIAANGGGEVKWQPAIHPRTFNLTEISTLKVIRSATAPGPPSDFSEVTARSAESLKASRRGAPKRERSNDASRFDILVVAEVELPNTGREQLASGTAMLYLVVEMKMNAGYDPAQLGRYSGWLHCNPSTSLLKHTDHNDRFMERISTLASPSTMTDAIGIGVFMAPNLPVDPNVLPPEQLTPAWSGVTFAAMVTDVLEPLLENPNLDMTSGSLIKNYIDLISSPDINVDYMPREHSELVRSIIDRHQATFAIIAKVLSQSDDPAQMDAGRIIQQASESTEAARRVEALTPAELVDAGMITIGTRFKHTAVRIRKTRQQPFDYDVIVELAEPSRNGFRVLVGPDKLKNKLFPSTTLLKEVYLAHGSKFTASGNASLTVIDGPSAGKTLVDLYNALLAQGDAE